MLHINDDRNAKNHNFSVMRVSHNIGKQSSAGIIGTYGNTLADTSNMVIGADLKLLSLIHILYISLLKTGRNF